MHLLDILPLGSLGVVSAWFAWHERKLRRHYSENNRLRELLVEEVPGKPSINCSRCGKTVSAYRHEARGGAMCLNCLNNLTGVLIGR